MTTKKEEFEREFFGETGYRAADFRQRGKIQGNPMMFCQLLKKHKLTKLFREAVAEAKGEELDLDEPEEEAGATGLGSLFEGFK